MGVNICSHACIFSAKFCPNSAQLPRTGDHCSILDKGLEFHGICDSLMYPSRVQEVG
jgi:hypothetical protein